MRAQRGHRDDVQDRLLGGSQHHRCRYAVAKARAQFTAVTHQRSPGASPGKRYCGLGVDRSLPMLRWWSRNSAVTTAQIRVASDLQGWCCSGRPGSTPVIGSIPHGSRSTPRTARSTTDPPSRLGGHSPYVPIDRSAAGCTLRPAHRSRATGARTRAAINESTRASSADRTPRRREATILSRELASSRSSGCGAS